MQISRSDPVLAGGSGNPGCLAPTAQRGLRTQRRWRSADRVPSCFIQAAFS